VAADQYAEAMQFWEGVAARRQPEADEPYASLGRLPKWPWLCSGREQARHRGCTSMSRPTTCLPKSTASSGLGATVTSRFDDYVILADPQGHPFCVVPVQAGV
jgi:hypothetical protein